VGLRGPPPKPTALRRLEGNPSRRALNPNEPQPSTQFSCEPPEELPEKGKEVWRALTSELKSIGLLTSIDLNAFHRYVNYLLQYHEAHSKIEGKMVIAIKHTEAEGGGLKYMMTNPYISIANQAADKLSKLEQQFGMTPAARARMIGLINGKPTNDEDPYGD